MSDTPVSSSREPDSLHQYLERDCQAMARYALDNGLSLPTSVAQSLDIAGSPSDLTTAQLARIHETLCQIVAPAVPRSIRILEGEMRKGGLVAFLGPVPLVRRMMLLSIATLVAWIVTSLSKDVNFQTMKQGVLDSSGNVLLLNLLFLLSAAGLGASFAALSRANRYIASGTFDPKYESSYWVRFTLGLVAGLILAELVPLGESAESETLTKPTLALIGGFSASVVHRALMRLVETVDTLVRGSDKEIVETKQLAARVRYQQMLTEGKAKLAADLMHLRQQVGADADPEALVEKLDRMLADVSVSGVEPEPEAGQPPAAKPSGSSAAEERPAD